MDDQDDFLDKKEKRKLKKYAEDEDEKRRYPSFILLCLIITFGIMITLGVSFSIIKFSDSNQTINTLISKIIGNDGNGKYIITYYENSFDKTTDGEKIVRDGKLHIVNAKFFKSTNGGKGEVKYFSGLFMITRNTFNSKDSTITYEVVLKNDSTRTQTFYGLIYNKAGDVRYKLEGIDIGDRIKPGETVTVYLTAEYRGKTNINFPITIDSPVDYNFHDDGVGLHITDAKFDKNKSVSGKGEVLNYEGMELTTKNTFEKDKAKVTYEVTIKNDSSVDKIFEGLSYNKDDNVKWTISGIKEGDKVKPGETKIVYLTAEYTGSNTNYPTTIESTVDANFKDQGLYISDAEFSKDKSTNGGKGEVEYYEGLLLTTKNTFEKPESTVAYEVTIRNGSEEPKVFDGLLYDPDGDVTWKVVGIEPGDVINPGESIKVYVIVEKKNKDENDYPDTIPSSTNFDFSNFTIAEDNGINLLNQFPTKDEVGKLFEGTNYVYKFTLMVGEKTKGAYYEITAVPNKDNSLEPSYVKLYLQKNNKDVDFSYKNGKVKKFIDYQNSEHQEAEGKVIYKSHITDEDINNGKIDFIMRMWVAEDVKFDETNINTYSNKKFSVKVNVYAQFEGE